MKVSILRSLIREMLLHEQTAQVQKPAAAPKPIPSFHDERRSVATQYLLQEVLPAIKPVNGFVAAGVQGSIFPYTGELTGALAAAGGRDALIKFCQTIEPKVRAAIKGGSLIFTNPAQWKANIRLWQQNGTPYIKSDEEAEALLNYVKSEIDRVTIIFAVADPAAPSSLRLGAAQKLGMSEGTIAFYLENAGAYVVNLVNDAGWRNVSPEVATNKEQKPATGESLNKIVRDLKALFQNPSVNKHVPAHEFGHAKAPIYLEFMTRLRGATAFSDVSSGYRQEGMIQDVETMRLQGFKSAVQTYSSDLIGARNEAAVTTAASRRRPDLKPGTLDYVKNMIYYARVLKNLGLLTTDNALWPLGNPADVPQYTKVVKDTAGRNANAIGSTGISSADSTPNQLSKFVSDVISDGGSDPFEVEHLADTIDMVQKYLGKTGDVNTAIQAMARDADVGYIDAFRARVLLDLAGPVGFKKVVQTFAAATPAAPAAGVPASGAVGGAGSAVA